MVNKAEKKHAREIRGIIHRIALDVHRALKEHGVHYNIGKKRSETFLESF